MKRRCRELAGARERLLHRGVITAVGWVISLLRIIITVRWRRASTGRPAHSTAKGEGNRPAHCVAILIPQLHHGGAERAVSRLAPALARYYQVVIFTFSQTPGDYVVQGVPVYSLEAPPLLGEAPLVRAFQVLKRARRLNEVKKRLGVDLIYSFGDSANLVSVLSADCIRVASVRGHARLAHPAWSLTAILKAAVFRESNAVVAVSRRMRETLISRYYVKPGRAYSIYNGYDFGLLADTGLPTSSTPDAPTLVSMGTYRHEKGYWHLISAMRLLRVQYPDIKLTLMGADPIGHRRELEGVVTRYGLQDIVSLNMFAADPFEELRRHSVYVLCSISEGFPNALVEAMSCGLPVVATDCMTGPREILAPSEPISSRATSVELHEYGILVPPLPGYSDWHGVDDERHVAQLAKAIDMMLQDPSRMRMYTERSVNRASDFGIAPWVDAHQQLFGRLGVLASEVGGVPPS